MVLRFAGPDLMSQDSLKLKRKTTDPVSLLTSHEGELCLGRFGGIKCLRIQGRSRQHFVVYNPMDLPRTGALLLRLQFKYN